MNESGVQWIDPPEKLAEAIKKYGERVQTAIMAVAEYFARYAENVMRQGAVWTDRTGNARSGLFSQAEQAAGEVVEIYLSHGHTVEYGKYLELANGGKYAIVLPTLERSINLLNKLLQDIFRD